MRILDWKQRFDKMLFLKKVRLIYSSIIIIPILLLVCFVWIASYSFISEKHILEVRGAVERNFLDIQNQMEQCEKVLLYISSNNMLKEFLMTDDNQYMERVELSKDVGPLIYNSLFSIQDFAKIQVYSEKKFSVSSDLFKNDAEILEQEWYTETKETSGTLWWYQDGQFFITRVVKEPIKGKALGVVRVNLKKAIFERSFRIFSGIPLKISLTDHEEVFYSYTNAEEFNDVGYEETRDMEHSRWQICYEVNENYFSMFIHPYIFASFAVVVCLLTCVWLLIDYITRRLLKNLYQVIEGVNNVADTNFEMELKEISGDEIGELTRNINRMIRKIRTLIDEVYEAGLERNELELNLLRAKINPHFLYNNLSAINWIAIEKGEERIYEISTQLANFYRTALNRGVNIDKLRVEMENVQAYLKLQMYIHEGSFDVEYEIDETLLDTRIPIFILQPLVENAIEHGIDTLREEKGKIVIRVFREENLLLIHIWDNGRRLYEKIGSSFMKRDAFGYGVSNVDKRIQLLYGESSGVRIWSNEQGTTSEIYLKREYFVLDEKF